MTLHIVFGPQGAGKTSIAQGMSNLHNASAFSIDEWMSTMYLPDMHQSMDLGGSCLALGAVSSASGRRQLKLSVTDGSAVLDLGMQTLNDRTFARLLIETHQIPAIWHLVTAPTAMRRKRVARRNAEKGATFFSK